MATNRPRPSQTREAASLHRVNVPPFFPYRRDRERSFRPQQLPTRRDPSPYKTKSPWIKPKEDPKQVELKDTHPHPLRQPGQSSGVPDQRTKEDSVTLSQAISERRSCALIDPDQPGPDLETLQSWIRLAITAPNHHFTFPWNFYVVRDDDRIRLGHAYAAAQVAAGTLAPERMDTEARKLLRAPVILFVACDTVPENVVRSQENLCACAAAVEHLLLLAHEGGFGAMWRTGAIMESSAARRLLGVKPGAALIGAIYIGRPDPRWQPAPQRRPELENVLHLGLVRQA